MLQVVKRIKNNKESIWSIFVLSVQAIILGFFCSLFFIDSTASFLVFHSSAVLPEAFVASGIAGIILIQFIHLSDSVKSLRIRFLMQYGLIFISFIILIALQFLTYTKFFLFFYFAAFLPFSIMLLNTQRSIISRIIVSTRFTLTILVDGSYIAGVVAGGAWALLFKRTNTIPVEYILAALLLLLVVLQILIRHYEASPVKKPENKPIRTVITYFSELPLKSTLLITGLFILFSAISFTMIDFTFLKTVETLYKSSAGLTKFLVLFFLATIVLTYTFKLFVYQNLIKSFKINKAIILAPAISILAFTGISFLMLFPSKFSLDRNYSLLFLGLVFSRIFIQIIRESFEFYSLKMNFVSQESLSGKKIDGGINSIFNFWAILLSGMILLILKSADITDLQARMAINLGVAIIWLLVAISLNKSYNKTSHLFVSQLINNQDLPNKNQGPAGSFDHKNISYLRYILNYQSYYQPHQFRKIIKQLPDNLKQKLGITLNNNNFPDQANKEKATGQGSSNGHHNTFFDASRVSKGFMIESLTESIIVDDRVMAVRLISESQDPKYINILKLLIRDTDDDVKRQAISAITKFKNTDLVYEALEYISHEDYADLICDVMTEIGPATVIPLSHTFSKPNLNIKYQSKIIKTISLIPCQESYKFLLNKLGYPNKSIVTEAASALIKANFQPSAADNPVFQKAIEHTIGNCAWLINMSYILEKEEKIDNLLHYLKEEFNTTFDLLFTLIELRYGRKLVHFIKQTRGHQATNEHREYGIEILNIIVEPEIKAKLFPLLHNNTKDEIIRQLQNQFPISKKTPLKAIREIINIDLSYVSKCTKSSAIIALSQYQQVTHMDDIIAQLYNPEPILCESAAYSISKNGPDKFEELEARLPDRVFPKLALLSENINLNKYFLINQKVNYLKQLTCFAHIKSEKLLHLAEIMEGLALPKGKNHIFETGVDEILPLFTCPYGDLWVGNGGKTKKLPLGQLYGLNVYAGKLILEANEDSFIYVLKPENITSVVLNFEDISDALFKYLNETKIQ